MRQVHYRIYIIGRVEYTYATVGMMTFGLSTRVCVLGFFSRTAGGRCLSLVYKKLLRTIPSPRNGAARVCHKPRCINNEYLIKQRCHTSAVRIVGSAIRWILHHLPSGGSHCDAVQSVLVLYIRLGLSHAGNAMCRRTRFRVFNLLEPILYSLLSRYQSSNKYI